jgi:predicted S18 family serine protease
MRGEGYLLTALAIAAILISVSGAQTVGSAVIRAPAVIIYNNTGSLTTITLTISNGNGTVSFANASEIASDTYDSAYTAAQYASFYAGRNFSHYNFRYTVNDGGSNVSGPSAGAAMTLLAISAFENKQLRTDFTITGTINPDGSVGQIGGALDKISAASESGLRLVLVPWVPPGDIEQGIYYIAQTEYKIPVVEISNITQAASFAFGSSSGVSNEVSVNFSSDYNVGALPKAGLNCSSPCNTAPFSALVNYTLATTRSQIANLSKSGSATVAAQLSNVTNQAAAIGGKGYLYVSADISFLSYLDAFYMSGYNTSRDQAVAYMESVQNQCSGLLAPQLTTENYGYVIAAELRQGWASYTINSTISGFNATGATRDDIVTAMYSVGQSKAWCGAASTLYGYPYPESQTTVAFSQSLGQIAIERINRASAFPGMYLTLAKNAYREGNYPVAIEDADYAYALSSTAQSASTPQLDAMATAMAHNATYGAWATEFSKEALFYVYESSSAKNSTLAGFDADEAFTSALLASQLSNDTKVIYESFVPAGPQTQVIQGNLNGTYSPTTIYVLELVKQAHELTFLVAVTLALLAGCVVLLASLAHKVMILSAKMEKGNRRRR